jgi:hypothetical protein
LPATKTKLSAQNRVPYRSAAALLASLASCLTTVAPPLKVGYHNPLDSEDGGNISLDGGATDAGSASFSQGMIDGRSLDLTAAVYLVTGLDGGEVRTEITLGDVANLCAFARADGGVAASYDLVRMRLAGDVPDTYLVSLALSPSGATAALQYQSDAGGFGTVPAVSGVVELEGVDPGNQQPAQGLYTLTFSATESLSGRFLAEPCAGLSPPAG